MCTESLFNFYIRDLSLQCFVPLFLSNSLEAMDLPVGTRENN